MRRKAVAVLLVLAVLAIAGLSGGKDIPGPHVLTIGRATDDVVKFQRWLGPVAAYLASRLKDAGVVRGEAVATGDNNFSTLLRMVKRNRMDIIIESPTAAALLKRDTDAEPVLIGVRKGHKEYKSIIFVRKDSGIEKLEDLRGKVIAFEDPLSNSSYFVPKLHMKSQGLELAEISAPGERFPEDKVGYVFGGSEINVSSWVFYRKVAAGAANSVDWISPEEIPRAYKSRFKIIYESREMPRVVLLVRKGLDPKLVGRIRSELLRMHQNEEGRKALKPYEIDKFVELDDKAREFLKTIQGQIEASGEKLN